MSLRLHDLAWLDPSDHIVYVVLMHGLVVVGLL